MIYDITLLIFPTNIVIILPEIGEDFFSRRRYLSEFSGKLANFKYCSASPNKREQNNSPNIENFIDSWLWNRFSVAPLTLSSNFGLLSTPWKIWTLGVLGE